jgi:hypothetical protein
MHKVIGCNKDHSKEIDLYGKTYEGKMERVSKMVIEAELALKQRKQDLLKAKRDGKELDEALNGEYLQKASYYFAQALLVFYYLIPDNDTQEQEVSAIKLECHKC